MTEAKINHCQKTRHCDYICQWGVVTKVLKIIGITKPEDQNDKTMIDSH